MFAFVDSNSAHQASCARAAALHDRVVHDDDPVAVVHVDREVARRRLALEGMETCEVLGRVPLID